MKSSRILFAILLLLVVSSSALSNTQASHTPALLDVFADASLSEALSQIKSDYEAHHQVILNLKLGSSEKLAESISEGAACDVFISSGTEYLSKADIISSTKADIVRKDGITYSAAVLSSSRNTKPALKFIGYLSTSDANAVFDKEGFTRLQLTESSSSAQPALLKPSKSKAKNK